MNNPPAYTKFGGDDSLRSSVQLNQPGSSHPVYYSDWAEEGPTGDYYSSGPASFTPPGGTPFPPGGMSHLIPADPYSVSRTQGYRVGRGNMDRYNQGRVVVVEEELPEKFSPAPEYRMGPGPEYRRGPSPDFHMGPGGQRKVHNGSVAGTSAGYESTRWYSREDRRCCCMVLAVVLILMVLSGIAAVVVVIHYKMEATDMDNHV